MEEDWLMQSTERMSGTDLSRYRTVTQDVVRNIKAAGNKGQQEAKVQGPRFRAQPEERVEP